METTDQFTTEVDGTRTCSMCDYKVKGTRKTGEIMKLMRSHILCKHSGNQKLKCEHCKGSKKVYKNELSLYGHMRHKHRSGHKLNIFLFTFCIYFWRANQ